MIQRLDRLGHHTVVRRDHQDRDVGDVGTAGPHLGERCVTGSVQEGHPLVTHRDLVGGNVLRDASEFAGRHIRRANAVEQRRLPVVHVPEDGDDGGAGLTVLRTLVTQQRLFELLFHIFLAFDLQIDTAFECQLQGLIFLEIRVDRQHLPLLHEHADQLIGPATHRLGEAPDRDRKLNLSRTLHLGLRTTPATTRPSQTHRRQIFVFFARTTAPRRTSRLAVGDEAPCRDHRPDRTPPGDALGFLGELLARFFARATLFLLVVRLDVLLERSLFEHVPRDPHLGLLSGTGGDGG